MAVATGGRDAVDVREALAAGEARQLQPGDGARVGGALVGASRRRHRARLVAEDELAVLEGEARDAVDVKVVAAEVGDGLGAAQRQRRRRLEGVDEVSAEVLGVDAAGGAAVEVERDFGRPQHVGGEALEAGDSRERVGTLARVQLGHVVEDGEGALGRRRDGGGGRRDARARVVLDAVAEGDELEDVAGRGLGQFRG